MSNKDKKNITSFDFGNKAAEKYTKQEAEKIIIDIINNSIDNNDILCLQDAYLKSNILHSTFYYLLGKFPELNKYKKDIQNIIISRINNKALKSEFNPASSIWRMKQLGEKDKTETDITTKGESIKGVTPLTFVTTDEQDY